MNKQLYARLLTQRKSEEEMFYLLIKITGERPRELIRELPINQKRAEYLLGKFSNQRRYDYGVSLDLGWVVK